MKEKKLTKKQLEELQELDKRISETYKKQQEDLDDKILSAIIGDKKEEKEE
jgi:hypothetical protein